MDKLCYWEIPTTDIEATGLFLAELFGWTMQPSGPGYVMFGVEDGMGGGLQQVTETPERGIRAYVGVDDIPATLAKAEALGGEITQPKTAIGEDWGFWAEMRLPGGTRLGLWSKD